jgi:hypothetical protein
MVKSFWGTTLFRTSALQTMQSRNQSLQSSIPLWRLAEPLGNNRESRALIGCFQVLFIIQTVGLFSDSNIV